MLPPFLSIQRISRPHGDQGAAKERRFAFNRRSLLNAPDGVQVPSVQGDAAASDG